MPLLKVVIKHFVASLEVIALHVVNHHILTVEQFYCQSAVFNVGMNATDIVVRDPYRVAVFCGIYHKIPRTYLVPRHSQLIRSFLDNLLKELLLVLQAELVDSRGEDGKHEDN